MREKESIPNERTENSVNSVGLAKPIRKGDYISELEQVNILLDGKKITAIIDSGSQLAIVNHSLVSPKKEIEGKASLRSCFNEIIEAELATFQISQADYPTTTTIPVIAAISKKLSAECILPPSIYEKLQNKTSKENCQPNKVNKKNPPFEEQKLFRQNENTQTKEKRCDPLATGETDEVDFTSAESKQTSCVTDNFIFDVLKAVKENLMELSHIIDTKLSKSIANLVNHYQPNKIKKTEHLNSMMENTEEIREIAKVNIIKIQEENRRTFNKKRKKACVYKEGDLVAIEGTQFDSGPKLRSKFHGPYKIIKIKPHDRYDVQ